MVCVEHRRLEQEYEDALHLWAKHAFPQTIAIPVTSPQHTVLLREGALSARNAAANRLYLHRLDCAVCKRLRIEGEPSD
jgi:hypothetical protein